MGSRTELVKDAVETLESSHFSGSIAGVASKIWGPLEREVAAGTTRGQAAETLALDLKGAGLNPDLVPWHMNPDELVVSSNKTIGTKQFLVAEGTSQLQLEKVESGINLRNRLMSDNDIEALLISGLDEWNVSDRVLEIAGADGAKLELSAAGQKVFASFEDLDIFASNIEKVAKDGRYSTLIADDVSGRIPALFVHDRLHRLAELHKTTPPRLVFMSGGFSGVGEEWMSSDKTVSMLHRIESEGDAIKKGNSLLITDMIASGNSVKQFANAFKQNGMKFDIAAMEGPRQGTLRIMIDNRDVDLIRGDSSGSLYAGGRVSGYALRVAVGVEKHGIEATSHVTGADPKLIGSLRDELYQLGRYSFEKSH